MTARRSVVALCGGVGGAKLALGLYQALGPDRLTIVVNTGDDFDHFGLHISPDVDTVTYTLGKLSNTELGWGRANETWAFMAALEQLGGETWFKLGDSDLAIHIERTHRLRNGESLTAVTRDFAKRLGIGASILPMSDDAVRTMVRSKDETLSFQHYFVRLRCEPVITAVSFAGAETARPNPLALAALTDSDLQAVVLCPSNPYLSVDPILAMPAMRASLRHCEAPVIAVSPIIGGRAVKGPTAKIMIELGLPVSNTAIARHYEGLLDGLVIDESDVRDAAGLNLPVEATQTMMVTLDDRRALANTVMHFAAHLRSCRRGGSPRRAAVVDA